MIEKIESISFREVQVFPPSEIRFYQLFKDGIPQPFIYSDSHLKRVFDALNCFSDD